MFKHLLSATTCTRFILLISVFTLVACKDTKIDDDADAGSSNNSAPTANDVSIIDDNGGSVIVGDLLVGAYNYSDADGDAEDTSTYRWLRNDKAISGATAKSYTLVAADIGETLTFEVTPVAQTGNTTGSAETATTEISVDSPAVVNSAPIASNVGITLNGNAVVGNLLTGTYNYSDADGDAEDTSTFRWLRDNTAISGATSKSYTLVAADIDETLAFEITPVAQTGNTTGNAETATIEIKTDTPVVINTAPVASNVGITLNGNAVVGNLLTGTYDYSDVDSDAEGASTYRWLRDDTAINGATAKSYTLVAADSGQNIRFEVTPIAATGALSGSPALSSATTAMNKLAASASSGGTKTIRFDWSIYSGATYYKLFVNPDGMSGYTLLQDNLLSKTPKSKGKVIKTASTQIALPVHLTDWVNASYILEAHNDAGKLAESDPMTITHLMISSIGYLKAANPAEINQFGEAVSISADGYTLAVGAPKRTVNGKLFAGVVYIFTLKNGSWEQQTSFSAKNITEYDQFGSAVSLSADGRTLAVAAFLQGGEDFNTSPTFQAGAAYIFTLLKGVAGLSDPSWQQQAFLKSNNISRDDKFATAISLSADGKTLAVGAPFEDGTGATSQLDSGAVYIFQPNASGTWKQSAYLKANHIGGRIGTAFGDLFGGAISLSTDGKTLAVGAKLEDSGARGVNGDAGTLDETDNSQHDSGAAYVFKYIGDTWKQQAYIKASNTDGGESVFAGGDNFGSSISLSKDGKTLAVGAIGEESGASGTSNDGTGESDNSVASSGAVYIFSDNGSDWQQQSYLKASNVQTRARFGGSLSLSADGNTLAVAAFEGSNGKGVSSDNGGDWQQKTAESGAVYMFSRSNSHWTQQTLVKAINPEFKDRFGRIIDLSADGNTLAVGAYFEDSGDGSDPEDNSVVNSGAVYIY